MSFDPDPYPRRPAGPRRAEPTGYGTLILALLLGAGLALGGLYLFRPRAGVGPALDPTVVEREATPKSAPDGDEQEAIRLFKGVKGSVVNVDTVVLVRRRLDMRVEAQQTGTGSGFFWDDDGRIVTNYHVVKDAIQNRYKVRVVLADRSAYEARVVGVSPDHDLAVVQATIPKDKVHKIAVGRSNDLEVGQKVYAIGNPFGLSLTMTKGIISALDRQIDSPNDHTITGAIQTDAPINPGNSGGPLLDKDGRLIGVNTSIASPSGGNVGIRVRHPGGHGERGRHRVDPPGPGTAAGPRGDAGGPATRPAGRVRHRGDDPIGDAGRGRQRRRGCGASTPMRSPARSSRAT